MAPPWLKYYGHLREALQSKGKFEKTNVIFSKGAPLDTRDDIIQCLNIKRVLAHDIYLGLPTHVRRKKKFFYQ